MWFLYDTEAWIKQEQRGYFVMKLTEDWIIAQAPNASAVQNGRKLSQKDSFSRRGKTEDGTLFWADCAGSGKNPYHTSIDLTNEGTPTCRCSCPSRQFPCKHAVGLMFEILAEKPFEVSDIPQDLAEKRAKQAKRAAKKETNAAQKPEKSEKAKKASSAQKAKKVKKQLEGIEKAEQMVSDLLSHGLGTLSGASAKTYETLAKELGSHYLTGAQTEFSRLANEIEKIQKKQDQADYGEAIRILVRLNSMLQKAWVFLQEQLDKQEFELQDNMLYEALGGIWRLEELERIGSVKENASLVQLSFDVLFDEARKEYIDRGYWLELTSGMICQTWNYRPVKALKYVKEDDTCFGLIHTPKLFCYPGTGNQRVRWESSEMGDVDRRVLERIFHFAQTDLSLVIKQVKNEIKNTMSEKYAAALLAFQTIGRVGEQLVLQMEDGLRITLRDRREDGEDHASVGKLTYLAGMDQGQERVIFGLIYYDRAEASLCLHPYSLITKEQIIRLQY